MFEMQDAARAFSRAWAKTGKRMAARIAMMAMTTSSSISVKPARTRPSRMRFLQAKRVVGLPGTRQPRVRLKSCKAGAGVAEAVEAHPHPVHQRKVKAAQ